MKDLNISIENLKHFCALAEIENINQTAHNLSISPSAISFSLSKIEAELDKKLFDRVGRKIQLNHEGREFAKRSQKTLDSFAELAGTQKDSNALTGQYVIGGSHYLMGSFIPDICLRLQRSHPEAKFELRSMDTYSINADLMNGQLDLAVGFSPDPHANISKEVLQRGELKMVVGPKHPLAGKKFKDWVKVINEYPYAAHKSGKLIERCDNHPMFLKHKIVPKINLFWDNDQIVLNILKSNMHWTLVPQIVAEAENKGMHILDLPKDWEAPYEISLMAHKMTKQHELIKAFRHMALN